MFALQSPPRQSGKRDSNPRPQPWQGCALPTELFPHVSRFRLVRASRRDGSSTHAPTKANICLLRRPSGGEGNRTPDLLNAIQALSQLSYAPGAPLETPNERSHQEPRRIAEGISGVKKSGLAERTSAGILHAAGWDADRWFTRCPSLVHLQLAFAAAKPFTAAERRRRSTGSRMLRCRVSRPSLLIDAYSHA